MKIEKPDVLSEIEAILKVSGVSACLPDEIKDSVCHSVAIDIVAHYEPLIQQAKAEVAREILTLLDSIFEQKAFVEYHVLFDTFRQEVKDRFLKSKG